MINSLKNWTADEEALIIAHYATTTCKEMQALLPERTYDAIKARAKKLQVYRSIGAWSAEDDAYMLAHYPTTDNQDLATKLARPIGSIASRAMFLKVKKTKEYRSAQVRDRIQQREKRNKRPARKLERTGTPSKPGQRNVRPMEKALPAFELDNPSKDLEKRNGLAQQLRALEYNHPLRQAYHRATPAGSPAGSAPRTMAQLQALIR